VTAGDVSPPAVDGITPFRPIPTREEHVALGARAREEVPLEALGEFHPAPDRPEPIGLLESQSADRISELVPVRYGRMLVSPLAFYRGSALLMASDLSTQARSPLHVQLCGDAHLSNFGGFASPERHLVFDINDFDETHPGPFEWDVKRLVASLEVAGQDHGLTKRERASILGQTVQGYREAMQSFALQGSMDVWYAKFDVDEMTRAIQPYLAKKSRKRSSREIDKARARTSLQAADKLTRVVAGRRQFVDDPPVIVRAETLMAQDDPAVAATAEAIVRAWHEYLDSLTPDRRHLLSQYTYVDHARKVVGVGSVGTGAWVMLLQGRDPSDLLMLQMKQAVTSVLEPYTQASAFAQHGERVVQGQRILQTASDIFLGWARVVDFHYYVRQLRDWKMPVDVDALDAAGLGLYGRLCGATLAKGHARSGDRHAIASYIGEAGAFDDAMASFARAYADQTASDFAALQAAADAGTITVAHGV
jgi:uncharacterized protein (DUF2252 family)